MYKGIRMKYVIKSVPSDDIKALEALLNEMSAAGWDLYSMQEVEAEDEGYQYNCIFATDSSASEEGVDEEKDVVNIKTFKSQMEKMLSSTFSPYESCKEIQEKIKEQRDKIAKIKTQLEAQEDAPVSKSRKNLNDEMSNALKQLDELRQNLIKTISPESMYSEIGQQKLAIELSEELLDLVSPDLGGVLISETVKSRQKLVEELGYVIPKIMFEDDDKLNPYEFSIRVRGLDVLTSLVYPGYLMFFTEDLKSTKKIKEAIYTFDDITGRDVVWIEEKKTKNFWENGLTPAQYISRLLEWAVVKNIEEIFDYEDVNHYIEIVTKKNSFLIENIIPDFVTVSELRYILLNLLREEVSIKDIVYIFEKINDFSDESSKEDLLDKIRLALSKYISKKLLNGAEAIQGFELSEATYKKLFEKVETEDNIVRIEGKKVEKIAKAILKKAQAHNIDVNSIVVFSPLENRHMLFMVLSQFISSIKVVAREEIANEHTVEILDEI